MLKYKQNVHKDKAYYLQKHMSNVLFFGKLKSKMIKLLKYGNIISLFYNYILHKDFSVI